MLQFALNAREQQFNAQKTAIKISRQNVFTARKLLGQRVLMYAPRGERREGYFGKALVMGVYPYIEDPNFIWLHLAELEFFDKALSRVELYEADQTKGGPYYTYSKALRAVSEEDLDRLIHFGAVAARPTDGLSDRSETEVVYPQRILASKIVRRSIIRFQMLEQYGPTCAFSGEFQPSLDGIRFAVQVGHLLPLWLGGPDVIQNVAPMSGTVNWMWDEGIFTMDKSGRIIISSRAPRPAHTLLSYCDRIRFPKRAEHWPKAEYIEAHRDLVFEKVPAHRLGRDHGAKDSLSH